MLYMLLGQYPVGLVESRRGESLIMEFGVIPSFNASRYTAKGLIAEPGCLGLSERS